MNKNVSVWSDTEIMKIIKDGFAEAVTSSHVASSVRA
jgi:hypothetical protein